MKKIILRHDSRDHEFHQKFGQTMVFPEEINFDTAHYDDVQPVGNVQCVVYTVCDIAEDQKNMVFDIDDLWKRIPSNQYGSDPRDGLGEAVIGGLKPKGKQERLKAWKSYWRADIGSMDAFDNIRSAMMVARSPVGVATYWYKEWTGIILPEGKTRFFGHMYSVEGWKQIGGEPHFIVEAWIGRKVYMSRDVFNAAMKPYGVSSWVLSTSEIDAKRAKTLIEIIKDIMINFIIKLESMIADLRAKKAVAALPDPIPDSVFEPTTPFPDEDPIPNQPTKLVWGNREEARHSSRVIMDEYNLTWKEKDLLCAVIEAESGFKLNAKNENKDSSGKVLSTDWGIVQINDYYHVGPTRAFKSVEEILDNPDKCIRFMVETYQHGHLNWWIAYKNGSYKKYLP